MQEKLEKNIAEAINPRKKKSSLACFSKQYKNKIDLPILLFLNRISTKRIMIQ